MKPTTLRAAVLALSGLLLLPPAFADTSFVVGRAASATGRVIAGQNIDLGGRTQTSLLRYGAAQHAVSDKVAYLKTLGGGMLPQASHTLGFALTRTEAVRADGTSAMRESYLNDEGVLILVHDLPVDLAPKLTTEEAARPVNGLLRHPDPILNIERPIDPSSLAYVLPTEREIETLEAEKTAAAFGRKAKELPPAPRGIVSGFERLMAERGQSARAAVEFAVRLVERCGWAGGVRQLIVADAKEAWLLALFPGRTAVARRVADDEIVMTAEVNTLGGVNLLDEVNTVVTPSTRERARALLESARTDAAARGESAPAPSRVMFRLADYIPVPLLGARLKSFARQKSAANLLDATHASGAPLSFDFDYRTHADAEGMRSKKKVSEDLMKVLLRSTAPDLLAPTGIANAATVRSQVLDLRTPAWATRATVASAHPAVTAYIPNHPLAVLLPFKALSRSAKSGEARPNNTPNVETATTSDLVFDYNDTRSISKHAAVITLFDRSQPVPKGAKPVPLLDPRLADFEARTKQTDGRPLRLAKIVSEAKAARALVELDASYRAEADALSTTLILERAPDRVEILADTLGRSKRTVKVNILSRKGFNAAELDRKTLRLGERQALASGEPNHSSARANALNRIDVNGDGHLDAVVTFTVREAIPEAVPGRAAVLYVTGRTTKGVPFIGYDTVFVR